VIDEKLPKIATCLAMSPVTVLEGWELGLFDAPEPPSSNIHDD
jgi:hypothetical protein